MPDSPCLNYRGGQDKKKKTIKEMKKLLIDEYEKLIKNKRYIQAFKVKMVFKFLLNYY